MKRALLFLLASLPAAAQEPPACTPARAGAVACMAGTLCECRFERGGSITGTVDGHRWNCGILRPACGEAVNPPANLHPQSPWMMQPEILVQPQLPTPLLPPPDRRLR
jgi:hypothetical protein